MVLEYFNYCLKFGFMIANSDFKFIGTITLIFALYGSIRIFLDILRILNWVFEKNECT